MKKTSPNHSTTSPGVRGGGGGIPGSGQIDETIDYAFKTDSASMRKKSKHKSVEKQKTSPSEKMGGERGDNRFFNGQSESTRLVSNMRDK